MIIHNLLDMRERGNPGLLAIARAQGGQSPGKTRFEAHLAELSERYMPEIAGYFTHHDLGD